MVRYPTELDDEFITAHGYEVPPVSPESHVLRRGDASIVPRQPVSWLHGWNFTTDLYRILEHVVDGTRRKFSSANGTQEVWSLFSPASMSEPAVMERVLSMYSALPLQFRETPPTTGDTSKDLFGFQSANIQATLQLLRMVLLSAEEIGVDRKCDVAGELLSVFSKVPVDYLKAISSPLVSASMFLHPTITIMLITASFIILGELGTSSDRSWKVAYLTHPTYESEPCCEYSVHEHYVSVLTFADLRWPIFSTVWNAVFTEQQAPANVSDPRSTESTGICVLHGFSMSRQPRRLQMATVYP